MIPAIDDMPAKVDQVKLFTGQLLLSVLSSSASVLWINKWATWWLWHLWTGMIIKAGNLMVPRANHNIHNRLHTHNSSNGKVSSSPVCCCLLNVCFVPAISSWADGGLYLKQRDVEIAIFVWYGAPSPFCSFWAQRHVRKYKSQVCNSFSDVTLWSYPPTEASVQEQVIGWDRDTIHPVKRHCAITMILKLLF